VPPSLKLLLHGNPASWVVGQRSRAQLGGTEYLAVCLEFPAIYEL